jgi:hypothetical protein
MAQLASRNVPTRPLQRYINQAETARQASFDAISRTPLHHDAMIATYRSQQNRCNAVHRAPSASLHVQAPMNTLISHLTEGDTLLELLSLTSICSLSFLHRTNNVLLERLC